MSAKQKAGLQYARVQVDFFNGTGSVQTLWANIYLWFFEFVCTAKGTSSNEYVYSLRSAVSRKELGCEFVHVSVTLGSGLMYTCHVRPTGTQTYMCARDVYV